MRARFLTFVIGLGLASALPGQTASYTLFGKGCVANGQFRAVPLTAIGLPKLGSKFTIRTLGSHIFGISLILTGASNTRYGTLPLPFDTSTLSAIGHFWCGPLNVSPDIIVAIPQPTQFFKVNTDYVFSIPNDRRLLGLVFYQQVLQRDSSPFDVVYQTSRGGRAVIGL